jgi:hypothetical protein
MTDNDNICMGCNCKLEWFTEDKISNRITEIIRKDAPLLYSPIHDIYKLIELDEYDIVEYDYVQSYIKYRCPVCGKTVTPGMKIMMSKGNEITVLSYDKANTIRGKNHIYNLKD